MRKKLLTLVLCLLALAGAKAQDPVDATIGFDKIRYWVGSGSDSAVLIVNFAHPDTALAWGFLFNGTTTARKMIDSIEANDPRFWTVGSDPSATGGDICFKTSTGDTLRLSPVDPDLGYNFWYTNHNGTSAGAGIGTTLRNGDVFKYGDMNSGTGYDMQYGYYMQTAWTKAPVPVPPPTDDNRPSDATIDASAITYWIGTGDKKAILTVNWADTALAWGYKFSGNATVDDMMKAVAKADWRFSYRASSFLDDIKFYDGTRKFNITPNNYWFSLQNGISSWGLSSALADGDLVKWGDLSVATVVDSQWVESPYGDYMDYTYVWTRAIHPADDPTSMDATVDPADILFWVGTGSNQAIIVVNWADSVLAWGYKFNGDTASMTQIMSDIAAADPSFDYTLINTFLTDITYTAGNNTLRLRGDYWWSLLNGTSGLGLVTTIHNGDVFKWGDVSCAKVVDSANYVYVWPYSIWPASAPEQPTTGPFCGTIGTEGCTAVSMHDSRIKGWATGCTVVRGPRVIGESDSPLVTFGTENDAIGASDSNVMHVVSLGDGGSATLTFERPIANGEGFDFAVFENSFNNYFLELAFVEVSSDGELFVRFPATSLTQTTTQVTDNVDPTFINNLAGKYPLGFGTPFDLDELRDSTGIDINNITHVRIVDVVGSIDPAYGTRDAYGNIVNDPYPTNSYSGGFDLDGVAVLHWQNEGIDDIAVSSMNLFPNPANEVVNINFSALNNDTPIIIYDMTGHVVFSRNLDAGSTNCKVDLSSFDGGIYIVRIGGNVSKLVVRQ